MKLNKKFIAISSLLSLAWAKATLAICPICTIAVAGGVGLSRYLGVDDSIIGLWVGGLTVSLIFWTIDWLEKKKWQFSYYQAAVVLGYYLLIVVPLYYAKMFGQPLKALAWAQIDKLLLGIIVGSAVFYTAAAWHFALKAKNDNKVYFPFQKVVFPVASLLIVSFIFYWVIKA